MITHTSGGFPLTSEQADVINAKLKPKSVRKVVAGAGTGKSTALEGVADNNPGERFLYIAFNRSVREKAQKSFPSNVSCHTFNSLAYQHIGTKYQGIGGGIMNGVGFRPICFKFRVSLTMAASIKVTLENFLNSADPKISASHLYLHPRVAQGGCEEEVLSAAAELWREMQTGANKFLGMTHSGCLKLLQLAAPDLGFRNILCDESQDTNPVSLSLLWRQVDAGASLTLVGDPRQQIYCQPKGTVIAVPSFINTRSGPTSFLSKRIEDVVIGDSVVSYGMAKGYGNRTGNKVTDIQKFKFSGKLVVVKAGNCVSRYTPEHHCVVRLGELLNNKFVVYLMKKGNLFRVGRTSGIYASQHKQVGISIRCSQEKAESMWVLSVHDTVNEAAFAEGAVAWKFGIPTMNFVAQKNHLLGQDGLDRFWDGVGDNSKKAQKLLLSYGRDIRFPLWTRGKSNLLVRRPFVTAACNLMGGMKVMLLSEFDKKGGRRIPTGSWTPVRVLRRRYKGVVYSLSVEKHHTYFGDGILTHNSWRGAIDAMQGIDCEEFRLTRSFRFGDNIAWAANVILQKYGISLFPLIGASGSEDAIFDGGLPDDRAKGSHALLARTNVGAFSAMADLIDRGETVAYNGDVGVFTGTIMDIFHLKQSEFDKVSKSGRLKSYRNYDEFLDICEVDSELKSLKNIVEKFKEGIPDTVRQIRDRLVRDVKFASVIVSTTHKDKGMEHDCATLADDFPPMVREGKLLPIRTSPMQKRGDVVEQEDLHIQYVAITRAKRMLAVPPTITEFMDLIEKNSSPEFYAPPPPEQTESRHKWGMRGFGDDDLEEGWMGK